MADGDDDDDDGDDGDDDDDDDDTFLAPPPSEAFWVTLAQFAPPNLCPCKKKFNQFKRNLEPQYFWRENSSWEDLGFVTFQFHMLHYWREGPTFTSGRWRKYFVTLPQSRTLQQNDWKKKDEEWNWRVVTWATSEGSKWKHGLLYKERRAPDTIERIQNSNLKSSTRTAEEVAVFLYFKQRYSSNHKLQAVVAALASAEMFWKDSWYQ